MEMSIFDDCEVDSIELRLNLGLLSRKLERNVSESSEEMAGRVDVEFTSSSGLALASMDL